MKKVFFFIFLCYSLFFTLTPPFQIPDEPEHFENIYWVSRLQYPLVSPNFKPNPNPYTKDFTTIFTLGNHSPMSVYNYSRIQKSNLQKVSSYPKKQKESLIAQTSEAYNPPLYYMLGAIFLKIAQLLNLSLLSQFYFARLASGLLYFATIYLAWKVFIKLFIDKQSARALTLFFALNPLLLKAGVGINPDIALVFFTTLFIFIALEKQSIKQFILLGLIAGLATLSKFSGIFLVGVYTVYMVAHSRLSMTRIAYKKTTQGGFLATLEMTKKIEMAKNNEMTKDKMIGKKEMALKKEMTSKSGMVPKKQIYSIALFLATFLLTQIPWEIFVFSRYHKLVIETVALGTTSPNQFPPVWKVPILALVEFRHTFMHFAGFLGWNDVHPGIEIYGIYACILALFIFIGVFTAFHAKENLQKFLACIFLGLLLFLYVLSLHHTIFYPGWDIQGRYLLPVWLPMVILFAIGITTLVKKPIKQVSLWLSYFAIFYYFFIVWTVFIPRFYV